MSHPFNPAHTVIQPPVDPELRTAILRMSKHVAWMFWVWIGIPLILVIGLFVLVAMSVSFGGVS